MKAASRPAARWLAAAAALFVASMAYAQRPAPRIGFVYPAGGQQGTTFTVWVGGQNLTGTSVAYVSGDGLTVKVVEHERPLTQKEINDLREKAQQLQDKRVAARQDATKPRFTPEDEKLASEIRQTLATRGNRQATPAVAETVTLEITAASDAPLGRRELRLKTPGGLTNPLAFHLGALPEITSPVVKATSARPVERPRPGESAAKKAAAVAQVVTLPAAVNGQILPGEVDTLRFTARQGQRLAFVAAARDLIPYLADAVPGWFQATLALHDAQGRELAYNDDFTFHPDPVVLWEVPADGDYFLSIKDAIYRGREDFVYRIAIGELPFVTSIFPLAARSGASVPLQAAGWNLPANTITVDTLDKPRGTFELTVRNELGLSNPVMFAVDERPALPEVEPNDEARFAPSLGLPLAIDGRIGTPGDVDYCAFEAAAGVRLVAEVIARRLGSPLDSKLVIVDAAGKTVAQNDDFEDKGAGLVTHHSDSRVEFNVPAAGRYFVRVTDAQRRGGADYGYRVNVGAPRPDFALRVEPSTLNVRAGASVSFTVHVLRRDGFTGDILLGLHQPPAGFALSGARIPAQQDKVRLTLTAPPNARNEPIDLKLVGAAMIDGKRIGRVAVPADNLMQAFAYEHLVPAQQWKVDVTGRGAALRSLARTSVKIPLGGVARVKVAAPGSRPADLRFTLADPIEGLTVKECVPQRDHVEVVIACDVAKLKPGTEGNLLLQAVSERRTGEKATKVQRNTLGVVPAIPYEIIGAPATPPI